MGNADIDIFIYRTFKTKLVEVKIVSVHLSIMQNQGLLDQRKIADSRFVH